VTEGAQLGCESTILLLGVGRSRWLWMLTSPSGNNGLERFHNTSPAPTRRPPVRRLNGTLDGNESYI
jgi:hypothetical protein